MRKVKIILFTTPQFHRNSDKIKIILIVSPKLHKIFAFFLSFLKENIACVITAFWHEINCFPIQV